MIKTAPFIAFYILTAIYSYAQQGKFKMVGYTTDDKCPIFHSNDRKTGDKFYDSRVIGYPRFFPGYIMTLDGEKVEGNIAVFNDQTIDWSFVKRCLLIIPDGQEEAQYLSGPSVALIYQDKKKEQAYYDLYEGGYLERLVSGKLRLSFNPNANTARKLTGFISQEFIDSLRVNTARQSIKESMKSGKDLQESVAIAAAKDQLITIGTAIEIIEKEYLLYNEQKNETELITKSNYPDVIERIFRGCNSVDEKAVKKYAGKYDQIVDAIAEYNDSCKE